MYVCIPFSLAANAAVVDAKEARGDVDAGGLVDEVMFTALGEPGEDLK